MKQDNNAMTLVFLKAPIQSHKRVQPSQTISEIVSHVTGRKIVSFRKKGRSLSPAFGTIECRKSLSRESTMFTQILNKSSANMEELLDNSVDLIVTSPPYNIGKEYEQGISPEQWYKLLRKVFAECYRVLDMGGRIAVNIAETGRKPYMPLQYYVTSILYEERFDMRGEIVWDKGASVGPST
jgi:hypothetical protein